MEIHMKSVAWAANRIELTGELAKILHDGDYARLLPRMNFNVFLKRNKNNIGHAGWGFLTVPTMEIGQKFLSDFGGNSVRKVRLRGRAIMFSQSQTKERRPDILEKITASPYIDPQVLLESEERASRLRSGEIVLKSIQFGWECRDDVFSIEWETIPVRRSVLAFDPERNQIRITLNQIFLIVLRFSQINYISISRNSPEPFVYFSLSQPPSFEQNTLFQDSRLRLSYLPFNDHVRVAPYTSLALRVICSGPADIGSFTKMCDDAQMRAKVDDLEIWTDRLKVLFSAEVVDEYQLWVENLPWEVAFQVEAIVQNMLVDLREMLSLRPKISDILTKHKEDYTWKMLRDFGSRLSYSDTEGNVSQWFDNAAAEFAKISKTPSLEPTDGSLFQAWHVTITPTSMFLGGPYPEQSNRVIRSYHPSNHSSFLRVTFEDEGGLAYRFERDVDGAEFIRKRVGGFLHDGLRIAGRHFHFLAYSQSALKEHSVWFVREFIDPEQGWVTPESIINSLGQFADLAFDPNLIRCPARYAARLSQAFTATDASVQVDVEEIQVDMPDIHTEDKKYCFTDGVGTVSQELTQDIWSELKKTRRRARKSKGHPKAFQIRFQGSKGMLCVNHRLSGRLLCLRGSMTKFSAPNSSIIEVARAFDRPTPYFLNRPLIMLLDGLGVPFETFKHYQDLAINKTQQSVLSSDTAARMLESYGLGTSYTVPSVLLQLHKHEICDLLSNTFWKKSMDFAVYHVLRELKNHSRIPIPDAWTLVGVADEHNYLQEGEIFACVKPHTGDTIYLEGDILISRSPTIHPGDVQVARAIGRPPPGSPFDVEPLPNTVVFNTKGKRPLASCLGGGDLDGDLYNLLPLNKMPAFRPRSLKEPASYDPAPKKLLDRPSNMKDVADFVVEFINSDVVGFIAINWLYIADQSPERIFDERCILLAQLHSDAVDYPKSGQPVELERVRKLMPKLKPDWSAPETNTGQSARYYSSQSSVGRLFRDVELPPVRTTVDDGHRRRRRRRRHQGGSSHVQEHQHETNAAHSISEDVMDEIESLVRDSIGTDIWVSEEATTLIEQLYERYVSELRAICATHTLSQSQSQGLSEEEAFMGTIVAKTSQPRKRKNLISKLREQTDILVRGVKEELGGDDGTPLEEVLKRARLAWYHALSKGMTFGAQTFGWITLHTIFDTARQIAAARMDDARSRFY